MSDSIAGRRRLKLGALVVAVVAALLLVVALLTFYAPPHEPPQLTEADVKRAEQAVANIESTVRQVETAAAQGLKEPFELRVDQHELTNYLRSNPRISKTLKARDIDAPKVEFDAQSIVTSCVATVRGRRVHITVRGKLSYTDAGRMLFKSDSVTLGRIPAPPPIKRKIDRAINDYLLFGAVVLPASITEISSEDGTLIIGGASNPDVATTTRP